MREFAVLAFVFLLAGCISGSSTNQGDASSTIAAPAAQPDENTGAITGLVIDDNLQGIANAQIGIVALDTLTVTDAKGAFTLNGVVPGEHDVVAQALGYESAGKKVVVVAGEITDIGIELQPLATEDPYHEMIPKKGYWTFAADTVVAVPNTGVANNEHRVNFDVGENWNTTQIEVAWKYSNPGQATTPGAWWNNQATEKGSTTAKPVAEVFGKTAPISVQFFPGVVYRGDGFKGNRPAFPEKAYNHNMYVFPLGLLTDETQPVMAAGFGNAPSRGVGVSFQQPFDVYASIFYFAPPEPGYTALPDA